MSKYEELKKAAEKATPGAWKHTRFGVIVAGPMRTYVNGKVQSQIASFSTTSHEQDDDPERQIDNADYCASANPSAILALLAERDQLLAALKSLLGNFGYLHMDDDDLLEEARLGNGKAPILLAAREAIARATVPS